MKHRLILWAITASILAIPTYSFGQYQIELMAETGLTNFNLNLPEEGTELGPSFGIGANFFKAPEDSRFVFSFSGVFNYSAFSTPRVVYVLNNNPPTVKYTESQLFEVVGTVGAGVRVGLFSFQPYLGISYTLSGHFQGRTIGPDYNVTLLDEFNVGHNRIQSLQDGRVGARDVSPLDLRLGCQIRYDLSDRFGFGLGIEIVRAGSFDFTTSAPCTNGNCPDMETSSVFNGSAGTKDRTNLVLRGFYKL